jgi:hypothetical protein
MMEVIKTTDDVDRVISDINLGSYALPVKFKCRFLMNKIGTVDGAVITAVTQVVDSEGSNKLIDIEVWYQFPLPTIEQMIVHEVYQLVYRLVTHELQEWFSYKGILLNPPSHSK